MTVSFTVPGEPRGKARPRMTRYGHAYTPEATVAYERAVWGAYMAQVGRRMPFGDKPVSVDILACMRVPKTANKRLLTLMLTGVEKPRKKADADNIAKGVCDALNGVAYWDDAHITKLTVRKRWAQSPCVIVTIEEDVNP
jgi:Holliday junction resolvase RusA-like endonuclease